MFKNFGELMQLNEKSNLNFWYPIVQTIRGIRTPRTIIIEYEGKDSLFSMIDGDEIDGLEKLAIDIRKASKELGVPFFLRTGLTSGKHNWKKTCYVDSNKIVDIKSHIYYITEFSCMADIVGLNVNTWVAREYLPCSHVVIMERYGNMPLVKERRYFIEKGKVIHRQPYWPEKAVKEGCPDKTNWKELLKEMNHESKEEVKELTALSELVGKKLKNYWSVDWLFVEHDWYLIDMARGELSYKYTP